MPIITFFSLLFENLLISLKWIWSWKSCPSVLIRCSQSCWYRAESSWWRGIRLWFLRLGFIRLNLELYNEDNRILTRDTCFEFAGWSVNWIGVFVKDWGKLSTNGFGGWFGKATGEIGEEEERRAILSGSVGKFKSSGDKGWSQSSASSSSCSSKGSGSSSEF